MRLVNRYFIRYSGAKIPIDFFRGPLYRDRHIDLATANDTFKFIDIFSNFSPNIRHTCPTTVHGRIEIRTRVGSDTIVTNIDIV